MSTFIDFHEHTFEKVTYWLFSNPPTSLSDLYFLTGESDALGHGMERAADPTAGEAEGDSVQTGESGGLAAVCCQ